MVKFLKVEEKLVPVEELVDQCLICITNPTDDEINDLENVYNIPLELLHDMLDIDERARIEKDENYTYIILRIPIINDPKTGIPYQTIPLGLIFDQSKMFLISLCDNNIISDLYKPYFYKNIDFSNIIHFVLEIFQSAANYYLRYLKQINFQTNVIEQKLEKSTRNKELHRMLKLEKVLVFFITSLRSNQIILEKLRSPKYTKSLEINEELLEDVLIDNKQAIEMSNIYSDIMSGLMDAFASIISNNLNIVMKQLTSITIILMIPNIIAGFFGMNIPNFLENSSWGFISIVMGALVLSMGGTYIFRKKNWM